MTRGTDVSNLKRTYRTVVEGEFPDTLTVEFEKECDLRYGENPNQPAAMYRIKGTPLAEFTNIRLTKSGKGGLSATNFMDVTRALEVLKFFDVPAIAVMKHLIPSGFARQFQNNNLDTIYQQARDSDTRSAFGSIVVSNRPIDVATAEAITSTYVEGVAAPEYEEHTMDIFERKKDLRTLLYSNLDKLPKFIGDDTLGLYDLKTQPTGRTLAQKPYLTSIRGIDNLILDPLVITNETPHLVQRDPTTSELNDLLTAWYINLGVRSNGIVLVKHGVTLAVASEPQERVGAVEQAIIKAYQKAMDREGIRYDPINGAAERSRLSHNPLEHAVLSSDAFFPFRDSIYTMARFGISAVIQPGGSVRDDEVIDAINQYYMAMVFTLERCFGHF